MPSSRGHEDLGDEPIQVPRFPAELEREIFICAAKSQKPHVGNLLLVAKRVPEWILPIIFKVVRVWPRDRFPIPFFELSRFQLFGVHIQQLLVSNTIGSSKPIPPISRCLKDVLASCPNVTHLALRWRLPDIQIDALINLAKLTHLTMSAIRLIRLLGHSDAFVGDNERMSHPPFTTGPPLLPNITHFNTYFEARWLPQDLDNHLTTLGYHLPGLTHIGYAYQTIQTTGANPDPIAELTLKKFPNLRVFALWIGGAGVRSQVVDIPTATATAIGLRDERVVIMTAPWMDTAFGTEMFELADGVIETRRRARGV